MVVGNMPNAIARRLVQKPMSQCGIEKSFFIKRSTVDFQKIHNPPLLPLLATAKLLSNPNETGKSSTRFFAICVSTIQSTDGALASTRSRSSRTIAGSPIPRQLQHRVLILTGGPPQGRPLHYLAPTFLLVLPLVDAF